MVLDRLRFLYKQVNIKGGGANIMNMMTLHHSLSNGLKLKLFAHQFHLMLWHKMQMEGNKFFSTTQAAQQILFSISAIIYNQSSIVVLFFLHRQHYLLVNTKTP